MNASLSFEGILLKMVSLPGFSAPWFPTTKLKYEMLYYKVYDTY